MANPTRKNYISDVTKAFGDITGGYTELVDLGEEYLYRRLLIYSSLDESVTLKFTNTLTSELVVPVNWEFALDDFWHDSVIEIKHNGDAPTEGFLKIESWRGE